MKEISILFIIPHCFHGPLTVIQEPNLSIAYPFYGFYPCQGLYYKPFSQDSYGCPRNPSGAKVRKHICRGLPAFT